MRVCTKHLHWLFPLNKIKMLKTKRIYEPFEMADGHRVLVDRLWPRGITKVDARLDEWSKEIAPSADLRRWFDHRPDRWEKFRELYILELEVPSNAVHLDRLRSLSKKKTLTLLYAARDEHHNNATVILDLLNQD